MTQSINTIPYIHNIVISVNVLVKRGNKYIVIKRSNKKNYAPGVIHPLGGKLEKDENIYSCALRETHEEAGVYINHLKLSAITTEVRPNDSTWVSFYFIADYAGGEIATTPEGKILFLTSKQLQQQNLYPAFEQIIDSLLSKSSLVQFVKILYNEKNNIVSIEKEPNTL